MNWTEGSLARHSRGRQRNALIARQKQHFAKVRSNLLNGQSKKAPVPFTISFLAPKLDSESLCRVSPPRHNHHKPPAPLLSINRETGREYPTSLHDVDRDALPTNLDRRKRLLEKSDWAGLRLQKPLDISFPGQIYATKRWTRAVRPQERTRSGLGEDTATHGVERRNERLRRSSMRIQIGSQEIRPSIATGSQPSIRRHDLGPRKSALTSQHKLTSEGGQRMYPSGYGRYGDSSIASIDSAPRIPTLFDKPQTPINVVYASSAIQEPAPRRNGDFPVLQWSPSSSEDRGSMQVEIERPIRPVPPSQESQQEKWRDWVLCDGSPNFSLNSPLAALNNAEVHTEHSESSSLTLPSHLQLRLPSLPLSSEASRSPAPEDSSSEDLAIRPIAACPEGSGKLLPSKQQQCIHETKQDSPGDLNMKWMKFACGDDGNSEELMEEAFKEAAHQAAVELRPSDTSDNAEGYTETAATCGTELLTDNQDDHDASFPDIPLGSQMTSIETTGSEIASSNIATVGSSNEPSHKLTRFIKPKTFVGKYANTDNIPTARTSMVHIPRVSGSGKRKRKRRKKMAMDGRTDIRNLPNFDGDPIEESEDD
ncbi:hypothetical protein F5Y14DRAFT_462094 [Nemania sp. NC0429]|nr:hypothetical protein F5Y14DRAFT_462094 [Nemania sp. NC0429]